MKNRTIIFGLKSDNGSREILLKLLALVVKPEDNVLVIHVQKEDNAFDPNTFHIHEDLCKSKQVDKIYFTFMQLVGISVIYQKNERASKWLFFCRLISKLKSAMESHTFLY